MRVPYFTYVEIIRHFFSTMRPLLNGLTGYISRSQIFASMPIARLRWLCCCHIRTASQLRLVQLFNLFFHLCD